MALTAEEKKDLKERMDYWQERLRIQDWRIALEVFESEFLPPHFADGRDDARASIRWDAAYGTATLYLATEHSKRERERNIVHEELHLLLRPLCALYEQAALCCAEETRQRLDDLFNKALEVAVNKLDEALVR